MDKGRGKERVCNLFHHSNSKGVKYACTTICSPLNYKRHREHSPAKSLIGTIEV